MIELPEGLKCLFAKENRNVVLPLLWLALIITSGQAGSADTAKARTGLVPALRENPRTEGFTGVYFAMLHILPVLKFIFKALRNINSSSDSESALLC